MSPFTSPLHHPDHPKEKPDYKIYKFANLQTPVLGDKDLVVSRGGCTTQVFNPSYLMEKDPNVYQSPMGMFGCAVSIPELNKAIKDVSPNLGWLLFELMATFPETFQISFVISLENKIAVRLDSPKETVYCFTSEDNTVLVSSCEYEVSEDVKYPEKLTPSELLYGFSIAFQLAVIGSSQFSIGRTTDNEKVKVSYIDIESMLTPVVISYAFPSMK